MTLLIGFLSPRRRTIARAGAGVQDTGGLNAASPLGDELLWAVVSGAYPGRDRKGGTDGQAEGAATIDSDAGGFAALRSPGWGGSGWYWPATGIALGTAYTLAFRLRLDPLDDIEQESSFPKLLSIPYRAEASWLMPFGWHLALRPLTVGATLGRLRLISPRNASERNRADSPDGFVLLDGAEHTYTVRVQSNGNVDWWRDDALIGTTAWQDFAHAAPDLGDAPHLITFAEHRLLLEEGLRGTMPAAAIWSKALSDQQIADFHTNPWDLIEVSTAPAVPAALWAWDDFVTLPAGDTSAVAVLANDSGTGRFVDSVTQPAGTHAGTGVAIVDGGAGIEVTIDEDEEAEAFDFTYTAKAPGDQESTATVHVEVFVPPPLGVDDAYTLTADDTHTVSPLANDNAPEGSTIKSLTQPVGVEAETGVAIAANDTDLEITIDAAETGTFSFTYTADGPGVSPWTQTVEVTVSTAAAVDHNDEPYLGRLYGSILGIGTSVGNTRLNSSGASALQHYFVSPRTGMVEKFGLNRRIDVQNTHVATRTATGRDGSSFTGNFDISNQVLNYGRGDSGRYNVYFYPADPSTKRMVPGSSPIGGRTAWLPTNIVRRTGSGNSDNWGFAWFNNPIVTCDQPFPLEANQPYVAVFDNTHANASNNYFSVNWFPTVISNDPVSPLSFVGHSGSGWTPAAASGGINGRDWYPFPVGHSGGSFTNRYGPLLFGLFWADGYVSGYTLGGGFAREAVTSTFNLRQRFMPSFDGLVVDGVWFWANRRGSQSGNIVISLEQGPGSDTSGNGTVLREASMPINNLTDVGASWQPNLGSAERVAWAFAPFASPIGLSQDTVYNVRARVSGSGTVMMPRNGNADGSQQIWSPQSATWAEHKANTKRSLERWRDSRGAQTSSNSGSSWSSIPNARDMTIALRRVV